MISPVGIIPLYVNGYWDAMCLLVLGAFASDWLDGHLARTYGWQSETGAWFDPLADKSPSLCIMGIILAHYGVNWEVVIPIALILVYDVSTMTARAVGIVVAASYTAKVKTAVLMFTLFNFTAGIALEKYGVSEVHILSVYLLWAVVALSACSAYLYFQGYLKLVARA